MEKPTTLEVLSGRETSRFYRTFDEALAEWRSFGGCLFYIHRRVRPWGIVDDAKLPCTSTALRDAAVRALKRGKLTEEQIAAEMKDWVD